jgi:cytidyltransferase-like protein
MENSIIDIGKRLDNLNNIIKNNHPQDTWILDKVLPLFIILIHSATTPEQEQRIINIMNPLFDNYEYRFGLTLENVGEQIARELLEQSTPIIALYPGKFKPPHAGHFDVVIKAAEIADKVIVIMSQGSKDEFTPEDSMKVWGLYKDLLPDNVQIIISGKASPVSEVFDIIKDKSTDFIVLYGKGEESRYRAIEKDPNTYSNVKVVDAGTFEGLHATDLRNAIRNKNLEDIQKHLPKGIDAKKILSIYTQNEFKPGPILHELFEKDLPNIEKLNSYEYKVGNGDDIEAIFYFNFEDFDNTWSVHWKFTENNKNTSPEAWKQVTATSYKILKDFIDSRHPKAIHISGNTDVKTNIYKSPIIVNKLKTLFNNEYRVDNSDDFSIVLRSIEESAKSNIKKRMETMNESYDQALKYYKNGDIFSKSKIERNDTLKRYNSRKQLSEFYNIPFKSNPLLEAFTPQKAPLMKQFSEYACNRLNIDEPKINIINSPTYSQEYHSFGGYIPSEEKIIVVVHNRNMADILRTLAHELVHHMQNLNGDELNGEDGSNTENEANAMAGVLMREFGRENPQIFEGKLNEKIVGNKIECDNCNWSWNIKDGGDDLFLCHKCGHNNEE